MKNLLTWKNAKGYFLGVIVITVLLWSYFSIKNEKELLRQTGIITNGIIIKTLNRSRGLDIKYEFVASGKKYSSWYKVYKNMHEGETIEIIFLPSEPTINRPKFALTNE